MRASGFVRAGEPLLVLLSGGADSVCLLDASVRVGARASALHVNYGLREGADGDEALCREICERLGVALTVKRASLAAATEGAPGNLQAEAREARYSAAERLVAASGGDYAAAHTASDQAETVLYRLAVSPGRRALLGMAARRGRLVRPLLTTTRSDTHAYCRARGLTWCEDPSNADRRFARARLRHEVLPVLGELNPAAERTIAETALLLRDEEEVLAQAVGDALARLGGGPIPVAELARLQPGLRRLVLRGLAERAAGETRSLSRSEADAILALGAGGGTRALDLGGLRAVVEYGVLRFTGASAGASAGTDDGAGAGPAGVPDPVHLPVPGSTRFGSWHLEARPVTEAEADTVGDDVIVSADRLGDALVVRAWRDGDRMRPAGLGGSKSLADLFTDRKVPRELRRTLPVIEAGGEIAWVAGVAVGEVFARPAQVANEGHRGSGPQAARLVRLSARRAAD